MWPVVQTLNFAYVAEKNRVIVVSIVSFMWTIFLSYMHHLDQDTLPAFLRKKGHTDAVTCPDVAENEICPDVAEDEKQRSIEDEEKIEDVL